MFSMRLMRRLKSWFVLKKNVVVKNVMVNIISVEIIVLCWLGYVILSVLV